MKRGVMREQLPGAFAAADRVFGYSKGLDWDLASALAPLGSRVVVDDAIDRLVAAIVAAAQPGDAIVAMSNGSFEGIHERLLAALAERGAQNR
jgi:UDP-N-acetylmuramate: L-alanyl-gamma-D-glutamyl-meso-diaminopimelate ligase